MRWMEIWIFPLPRALPVMSSIKVGMLAHRGPELLLGELGDEQTGMNCESEQYYLTSVGAGGRR